MFGSKFDYILHVRNGLYTHDMIIYLESEFFPQKKKKKDTFMISSKFGYATCSLDIMN